MDEVNLELTCDVGLNGWSDIHEDPALIYKRVIPLHQAHFTSNDLCKGANGKEPFTHAKPNLRGAPTGTQRPVHMGDRRMCVSRLKE